MHNQSSLIMCSSRWVLGALSRCRCCASNIHVLGASTLASPWTWIMPRKSAAPRDARESCYWQPGGPSALRTSGRTTIISRLWPQLIAHQHATVPRLRLRLRIFPRPPWGAPRRVHSSHGSATSSIMGWWVGCTTTYTRAGPGRAAWSASGVAVSMWAGRSRAWPRHRGEQRRAPGVG